MQLTRSGASSSCSAVSRSEALLLREQPSASGLRWAPHPGSIVRGGRNATTGAPLTSCSQISPEGGGFRRANPTNRDLHHSIRVSLFTSAARLCAQGLRVDGGIVRSTTKMETEMRNGENTHVELDEVSGGGTLVAAVVAAIAVYCAVAGIAAAIAVYCAVAGQSWYLPLGTSIQDAAAKLGSYFVSEHADYRTKSDSL